MKTLKLIAIALVLFSISANAQITKGNWMVGGSAGYNSTSSESSSNGFTSSSRGSNITLFPTVGHFIANNFACGLAGSFSISFPDEGESTKSYGLGPFIRYYFLKPEKTVNLLSQISYFYGEDSNNSNNNEIGRFN